MTFEEKVKYFEEKQAEIVKLDQEVKNKMEVYKAEFKSTFGLADGEPANLLDLVKAMKKVQSLG